MPHIDLLELPYFQGISINSLVGLIDVLEPIQFTEGSVIIAQGQAIPPPLYIATHGKVAIIKNYRDKGQRIMAELEAPTLFGEVELFCQLSPVATISALTEVSAFILNRQKFNQLFGAQNPAIMQFTFNIARVACHRLALADEMLAQVLSEENLVQLRHSIFAKMSKEQDLSSTTGAFKVPVERK